MKAFLQVLAADWRVKVAVQNVIGLVPGSLGFSLNEWLAGKLKGSVEQRIDLRGRLGLTFDALRVLRDKCGVSLEGAAVLELGTGWHGIDPLVFFLLGAKSIVTVDHHEHLSLGAIRAKAAMLAEKDILLSLEEFGRASVIRARIAQLMQLCEADVDLRTFLAHLNARYEIRKSCSVLDLNIRPKSIDVFYSSSVLQRIPEADLRRNVSFIAQQLLSERAVVFHLTDQRDVNSLNDPSLWHLDYLRFEEPFFRYFVSGRFNTQNRLREADFVEIFQSTGIRVEYIKSVRSAKDIVRLRSVKLGRRFAAYPIEELATYHSHIAGRVLSTAIDSGLHRPERELVLKDGS